jgi:hypothetical protein
MLPLQFASLWTAAPGVGVAPVTVTHNENSEVLPFAAIVVAEITCRRGPLEGRVDRRIA